MKESPRLLCSARSWPKRAPKKPGGDRDFSLTAPHASLPPTPASPGPSALGPLHSSPHARSDLRPHSGLSPPREACLDSYLGSHVSDIPAPAAANCRGGDLCLCPAAGPCNCLWNRRKDRQMGEIDGHTEVLTSWSPEPGRKGRRKQAGQRWEEEGETTRAEGGDNGRRTGSS